jgi:DNA-binding CsgD family transcriptional regulator
VTIAHTIAHFDPRNQGIWHRILRDNPAMPAPSPRSLLREVQLACRDTSGAVAIECAVAERLQQAVPFDAWCALTIDPASVLPTGGFHECGVPAPLLPHLVQIEAHADDALALPTLARGGARVHTLSGVTAGHPDTATHYREVLAPAGLAHELRVAFTTTAGIWGVLVFFRGTDVPDFTAAETALIDTATAGVASAIRRELVLTEAAASDAIRAAPAVDGPGVILLDAALIPLAVTSTAQRWLAEINDGHDPARALPWAVLSLATRAVGGEHEPRFARVRTRAGRWISLYAERLATDPVQVTMIIEPCRPTEIAQIIADAYQLTPRERDIVGLLSTGHSRADIARLLVVSSHTVDDHIKRVYGKLGVRSRPELTAKIFFDQHIPRIHHDVPVGGTGWFLR